MSAPSWPGTKPDASRRLEIASHKPRPSIGPPDHTTVCDRCQETMGTGIYRLAHGHVDGALSTWHVCQPCHESLTRWLAQR